jgi:hypothetical protein
MRAATLLVALLPSMAIAVERGERPVVPDVVAGVEAESAGRAQVSQTSRVDALIEASRFSLIYDKMMSILQRSAPEDPEAADIWVDFIAGLSWDAVSGDWRRLFAERLTPEELDVVIAYYRSSAGQAMLACQTGKTDTVRESECSQTLQDADHNAYLAFRTTPAAESWSNLGGEGAPIVMCAGLRRDPRLVERLAAFCAKQSTFGLCRFLESPGNDGEPSFNPEFCPAPAPAAPR